MADSQAPLQACPPLNINGFYDLLLAFLDHCVAEGLLKPKNREILLVASTIEDALTQLAAHT
jgi:predicted Rossmann-fold nucleotide-binding protein